MDNDSQIVRQDSGQDQSQKIVGQVISAQGIDAGDWRTRILPAAREKNVSMMLDSLRRHIPISEQEGMQGPKMLAVNFEEKIFVAATSQSDYCNQICLKLLAVETQWQNLQPTSHQYYAAMAEAQRMDPDGWRAQLQPDSRQRIVTKIMDTLKRHLPFSGQEGLQELMKIAVRFEEKIYTSATSQSDYLRKISLKMLTMDIKCEMPSADNPPQRVRSL